VSALFAPGEGPGRYVATAARMRAVDREAVERYGVPAEVLMENAGRAAADAAQLVLAELGRPAGPVLVLAGPGNNGGDGFCLARTVAARGVAAVLWEVGRGASESPERRLARELWRRDGGLEALGGEPAGDAVERLERLLATGGPLGAPPALVVDALFGTGLARDLAEPYAGVLGGLVRSGTPLLALDLPSGLEADTGRALGPLPVCRMTVTFGALKPGLLEAAGAQAAGRILVAEIGLPQALLAGLEPLS
jgi:ADP-dependent NAD(P)H-hydrate dehydratase / NAD(P)H-hydrate epimerase